MYPLSVSGVSERKNLSASGVFVYSSPRFSSSPSATQASSKRGSSLQSAGRRPSKIPNSTAANMVLERRNASIKSRTMLDVTMLDVVIADWRQLLTLIAQSAGIFLCYGADPDSRNAVFRIRRIQQLVVL